MGHRRMEVKSADDPGNTEAKIPMQKFSPPDSGVLSSWRDHITLRTEISGGHKQRPASIPSRRLS